MKFDLVDGPGNGVELYRTAVDYVAALMAEGVPVVVNCVGGRSRSAAVLCSALAKHQKTDFNAAYSLVKKARDEISIHPALMELHWKLANASD
jgi:protein-tyrosine phosphatase